MYTRLFHDADDEIEVFNYYTDRSKQLAFYDYHWCGDIQAFSENNEIVGYYTIFTHGTSQQAYLSFFVLKSHRGKTVFLKFIREIWSKSDKCPFITVPDCGLISFFDKHKIPYVSLGEGFHFKSLSYRLIEIAYGSKRAKRSGVPYMYHIDEGLTIMKNFNFGIDAMNAYCLHPLFQEDEQLWTTFNKILPQVNIPQKEVMLALEYRNIANAYLAHRYVGSPKDIALSPIKEVNQMLVADKIQNYKDFMEHHKKHPKYHALKRYFENWFRRLDLDQDTIDAAIRRIS